MKNLKNHTHTHTELKRCSDHLWREEHSIFFKITFVSYSRQEINFGSHSFTGSKLKLSWIDIEVIFYRSIENKRDNKNNPFRKQDRIRFQVKLGLSGEWHAVFQMKSISKL